MKKRTVRKKRAYRMQLREVKQAETRARIVEATMELHGEVGPRDTTIKAIAERAGVERLTVYRHFPSESEVFTACSHRFRELNPPPERIGEDAAGGGEGVTQEGLQALYDYYSRTAYMLEKIYRDRDDFDTLGNIMKEFDGYIRDYAEALLLHWKVNRDDLKHTLWHAVRFTTWQSLESDQLPNEEKVELITSWANCVAE